MPHKTKKLFSFCGKHPFIATFVYIAIVSAIFLAVPRLDIWATQLFYAGDGVFPASVSPFFKKLRYLGPHLMTWIAAISVILLLLKLLIPSKKSIVDLRAPLFLITTLIMGPGIVVNAILKNNWGRPRPKHIEEFGGVDPFIGIWNPTDICPTNCSFVSGEASMAIWLFAVVFLLPRFWKWPAAIFIAILCLVFSANRVAFGGHFLSDTLLSWGITMLVILTTYFLLYRWTPKWAQPEALDSSFSKAGFWLHKKGAIVGTRIAEAFKGFIAKFR